MPVAYPPLTAAAEARLRAPRTRGAFRVLDAARRQLALLEVADGDGQASLSWLVDPQAGRIEDARFLAFGSRWSHPAADAFTQLARGMSLDAACSLGTATIEAMLRDRPDAAACDPGPDGPLAFIPDLQRRARVAVPRLVVPPKPVEKVVYQRKRQQDWDEADRRWLPLSLLKKIAQVDVAAKRVLADRAPTANHRIEGLHDDFRVVCLITGIDDAERETMALFLGSALREIHPELVVSLHEGAP